MRGPGQLPGDGGCPQGSRSLSRGPPPAARPGQHGAAPPGTPPGFRKPFPATSSTLKHQLLSAPVPKGRREGEAQRPEGQEEGPAGSGNRRTPGSPTLRSGFPERSSPSPATGACVAAALRSAWPPPRRSLGGRAPVAWLRQGRPAPGEESHCLPPFSTINHTIANLCDSQRTKVM